ncbi:hypothetical protein PoB_006886000 [Plakobranchus ocellatus]|uniref:Uncharacterized protein n=1 Tax=Plakobranchus ocellatus TaxID=259542 RepID=A0AAV4DE30_9GAST|nr:hypothetical protein PoB_006886000 [Plakobranchus ocellatus]
MANPLLDLQGPFCRRFESHDLAPGPDGGSENPRSPCNGLAVYKNQNTTGLAKLMLQPVHNKVISGFQALCQIRARGGGARIRDKRVLQISGWARYPQGHQSSLMM